MQALVFEVTENSKVPFLLELLSNFDFIKNIKVAEQVEILEDIGLAKAMKVAEKESKFLNHKEALNFLEND